MPKASPNQTTFSGGEYSPLVQGRVEVEAYKKGLATCVNYIPTLQGPLVRRPGTKYVANVKDPSLPPTLIPFQFSASQSYMLEFGDSYIRFFANEGQIVTNSTVFSVAGNTGRNGFVFAGTNSLSFSATRPDWFPQNADELITASSVLAAGSILELTSPYLQSDVANIRFAQKDDVLYLVHKDYTPYKLQRFSAYHWTLKPVFFQDGPFLPNNSYSTIGDSTRIGLSGGAGYIPTISTEPNYFIYGTANNGAGAIRVTTGAPHAYATGDRVCIVGALGTVEMNNGTSSISATYWPITVVGATQFDLVGSTFVHPLVGSSALVRPALFQMIAAPFDWKDATPNELRRIAVIVGGIRYWGSISGVFNAASVAVTMDVSGVSFNTPNWQLGVWSTGNGFPSTVCFHQDRLVFSGAPSYPLQVDMSMSSDYEHFAISNSTGQIADYNALSLHLLAPESNPIRWVKPSAQGLLAGAGSCEWQIAPDNQQAALTPTNRNAIATSFFGSAPIDSVQAGNAILYVQNAFRKIREMNYFFQVGTFRSTDLSELSEHITVPGVTKLAVQKESLPLVWAVRSDGQLLSMSYNRDDQTIKAGWARHYLGGQSDAGGTIPQVKSIGVISASSASFDQLWMTVQRSINGTSVMTVEFMTQHWNAGLTQADGYCLDGGATYDNPKFITGLTSPTALAVTSNSHGFSNGDQVRIYDVVGFTKSTTDINGNIAQTSFFTGQIHYVQSSTVNAFSIADVNGQAITCSSYIGYLGGGRVRKLVSTISGITWLKNETVSVVADGGVHPDAVVNSAGVMALAWPAAKVQFGYKYNSDGGTLRSDAGSATGSSIGMTRRIHRAAFLLNACGDFSFGPNFSQLLPCEFPRADDQTADAATPLYTGLTRDGVESIYDLDDALVFRQNTGLPGMVQSVSIMMEEIDV